ncbi:alpha/beta hydrolase [Candidatus Saccharibacteria bacterium]|nr:alpha/beta hydrolase [Candidatus Saccharibacteria bacterium]
MQEKVIELPSSTIHYWQNKAKKNAPTIVMVHGFRGTHHGLLKIATNLGDKYNLIIPDLPGFGASQPFTGANSSLPNFVKFLQEFIDTLELKTKPHLLAHSFGTIIASAYVAENPSAINKLILLSPVASAPLPELLQPIVIAPTKLVGAMPEKLGHHLMGNYLVTDIMTLYSTKTKDPELKKWIKAEHRRYFNTFVTTKSMTDAFIVSLTDHVATFAPKIPNPTLIVYGDKDNVAGAKRQKALSQLFTNVKSKSIPKTGHLIPYEVPEAVAKAIDDFVHAK